MTFHKKINNPNSLDYFGVRRLKLPPPHFVYNSFKNNPYNMSGPFVKWITTNLTGRFYVDNVYSIKTEQYNTIVGFELSHEMTYFLLACPYI